MPKSIIVIDDDEAVRKSFTLALEETKFNVDTAESGEKGIEMMKDKVYDTVFLDLKMPGIDGVQTMWKIRDMNKDLPIYIITAFYAEFSEPLKAASRDGLEFQVMQKTLDSGQIVSIVKGMLEGPINY